MGILDTITKEVFEHHVPGAKMPERQDSVFLRIQQLFTNTYDALVKYVVGTGFETTIDTSEAMQHVVVRYVCQKAFVDAVRSLDLVLTATGFGIVSTPSLAPASKSRVDALLDDMRLQAELTYSDLLHLLIETEGWGGTSCAARQLPVLFWDIRHLERLTTQQLTADNWQRAKGLAAIADSFLRDVISDEYMEVLLARMRTNALNSADTAVITRCNHVTATFISNYDSCKMPDRRQLDTIMDILEQHPEEYPVYATSRKYKARHAQRYQNKEEDPTVFIM